MECPCDVCSVIRKSRKDSLTTPLKILPFNDEQLWTEYAKAALTGLIFDENMGVGESLAQDAARAADAMLEAHNKRWGHG